MKIVLAKNEQVTFLNMQVTLAFDGRNLLHVSDRGTCSLKLVDKVELEINLNKIPLSFKVRKGHVSILWQSDVPLALTCGPLE